MSTEHKKPPNILLIQTDQQSWNTLRIYGNPVLETPALEALAERGVAFENAYCNYPACAPSRSSMMTGRYTSAIRCHANHMHIDPREVTLPGVLRANGYRTALIGKNHAFMETPNTLYPNAPATDRPVVEANAEEGDSELHRHFDHVLLAGHTWMQGMDEDSEFAAALHHATEKSWGKQHQSSTNPYPPEKSIISWPESISPQRTSELVELVDVMPTLLDAAGITHPGGLQGNSLLPFLSGTISHTKESILMESGELGHSPRIEEMYDAEGTLIEKGSEFAWCAFREAWQGRGRAIRTARWKLALYENGDGELYDLETDPDECTNRFQDPSCQSIREELLRELCMRQMRAADSIPINTTVDPSLHWTSRPPMTDEGTLVNNK